MMLDEDIVALYNALGGGWQEGRQETTNRCCLSSSKPQMTAIFTNG